MTSNPRFWSECSNFIDSNLRTIRPKPVRPAVDGNDQWDDNAAFACMDKFLFRKKMLYACIVSDSTIETITDSLEHIPHDAVLAEPPSELSFVVFEAHERIPIDRLRKNRTANPMTNLDFNAVTPKPTFKEERMWYTVPNMTSPKGDEYHQQDSSKIHLCAQCSINRSTGKSYDLLEDNATHCPNCASNFNRKFYFGEHDPSRADMILRWAASVIIGQKRESPYWGALDPNKNLRLWVYETMRVFRSHTTGIGKYVSHFGTTRMGFKIAANAMFHGQGKQITVDRHQTVDSDGKVTDYYQFSFDHGNRLYSDYMRMLFTSEEIANIVGGHHDPKEELLGDCIEICLGILRVAMMYEGYGEGLFQWKNSIDILTGLELSLLVFNASAYPSGPKNRKITNKRSKRSYSYEDCLEVSVPEIPNIKFPVVIDGTSIPEDADMEDANIETTAAEGKEVGTAAPSTEAPSGDQFVSSGVEASKRRRLSPQMRVHGLFEGAKDMIDQIITSTDACANCLSIQHSTSECPNDNGQDWLSMLISVRDGMEERNQNLEAQPQDEIPSSPVDLTQEEDVAMEETQDSPSQQPESSSGAIVYYDDNKSFNSDIAGGKDPKITGYRRQEELFDVLHKHIIETKYIPQKDHRSSTDQRGMRKYSNWASVVKYGKVEPLNYNMANFADPLWGNQCYDTKYLKRGEGYNHQAMRMYTQRWTKVLRHSIGQLGKAACCDELGWVSVEEFIRNDHAWPYDETGQTSAWDHQTGRYREDILAERRLTLMEGYWYRNSSM